MSTNQMTNFVIDQPRIINGTELMMMTVDGMDRVQINNKLHDIGDQILKLRMQQDALVQMRDMIDRECEMKEMNTLFDDMFGG
jgi:hypothetical protein